MKLIWYRNSFCQWGRILLFDYDRFTWKKYIINLLSFDIDGFFRLYHRCQVVFIILIKYYSCSWMILKGKAKQNLQLFPNVYVTCKWISEPKDVYSFEEGVILSFACIIFANCACIVCRGKSDLSRGNFDKV